MTTTTTAIDFMPVIQRDRLPHVTADIAQIQTVLVNLFLVGQPGSSDWVLIDAGIPGFTDRILHSAHQRFGASPPKAILLTHGHFDHVGSLSELLQYWDVPVYAHELELPYLTGQAAYPPADPTVGGGFMAWSSKLFPRQPYDFRPHVRPLPTDGSVPGLPEWRWIATPGHSPGHVSFFRDSDGALVAGDAFTTQKQESFFAVMTNHQHIHGPPAYFTINWGEARQSVTKLASLNPNVAATGHGLPMYGQQLRHALRHLATRFDELAVPRRGRYVRNPVLVDRGGPVFIPPMRKIGYGATLAVALLSAGALWGMMRRR